MKRQWFAESGPTSKGDYQLDFRAGGTESGSVEIAEGPGAGLHENATPFVDIVEGERIGYAYTMAWNGRVHSASLATVTFAPNEAGRRVTVTERGAFLPRPMAPECAAAASRRRSTCWRGFSDDHPLNA